jgi:methionine-rich copper-binding protein CopC
MKWLSILLLLTMPAFAGVRLADADPEPGEQAIIEDNEITLTFGEAILPMGVVVTDAKGRVVSTGKYEGTYHDIAVLLKAAEVSGYPCGPMRVQWRVIVLEDGRQEQGEYSFTIRPHHGTHCH